MNNPYRIGTDVYLRPVEEEDLPKLKQWINDPEVKRFLAAYMPFNDLAERSWFERISKSTDEMILGIALMSDDRLIGVTGFHQIHPKDHRATFGISIGEKSSWNKGYGFEATRLMTDIGFDTLNLHRIELQVYDFNERAIRVYEKAGWVREGASRERHYHNGRFWDVINMAILRQEWDALRKS